MRLQYIVYIFLCLISSAPVFSFEPTENLKVTTVLKATESWDGQKLSYPQGQAEITGMIIEVAAGAETGWHLHAVPSFGMVLEGEIDVHLKDGRVKKVKKGETLAEVVNTYHNGRNNGTVPVKILVFYAGSVGQALTTPEKQTK
jgi:quercetin dioxygenase-like cupin family protein